jgi:hypothetical protein
MAKRGVLSLIQSRLPALCVKSSTYFALDKEERGPINEPPCCRLSHPRAPTPTQAALLHHALLYTNWQATNASSSGAFVKFVGC